ncbi:MAG: MFS transporter [Acidobacteriota bacterium]
MRREHKYSLLLVGLAYLSFVSLGLPDGLNGVAWPSIRAYFHLPLNALGWLLVMFTAGYFVASFSSGRLLALMSIGTLLSLSCLATAVSLIGYALAPVWMVMVGLGTVAGFGAGAIDAGLNTFAATQFSARMVGRLLSGLVAEHISIHRLLRICLVNIVLGAILIWLGGSSFLSFAGLGLMGLASAPVFPSLISATPLRLGEEHIANGVGFQIAAAVLGQSFLPTVVGALAGWFGLEVIGPTLLIAACLLLGLFEALRSVSRLEPVLSDF